MFACEGIWKSLIDCKPNEMVGDCIHAVSIGALFQHIGVLGILLFVSTSYTELNDISIEINISKSSQNLLNSHNNVENTDFDYAGNSNDKIFENDYYN